MGKGIVLTLHQDGTWRDGEGLMWIRPVDGHRVAIGALPAGHNPDNVHPSAVVHDSVIIGAGSKIWHFTHVEAAAIIGKNVMIGQGCYIAKGVEIADGVRIQNGVSVYYGVILKEEVFVGPNVTFTNDLTPRAFDNGWDRSSPKTTLVERGASIGANATILSDIGIGEFAMVGAGSVVTQDVPPHALVTGNPARLCGYVCRRGHRVDEFYRQHYCAGCGVWLEFDKHGNAREVSKNGN